jgi:hypothetical protein
MSIYMKFAFNFISITSGIVTIVTIFVAPSNIRAEIVNFFPDFINLPNKMLQYAWYIVLIPAICGIYASRKHNGFSRFNPMHLFASILIYPFWIGVGKGTKLIGLVSLIVIIFIMLQKNFN